jgi:hypothetical protein
MLTTKPPNRFAWYCSTQLIIFQRLIHYHTPIFILDCLEFHIIIFCTNGILQYFTHGISVSVQNIQGIQKVSIHLMITIQKVTSNVPSGGCWTAHCAGSAKRRMKPLPTFCVGVRLWPHLGLRIWAPHFWRQRIP